MIRSATAADVPALIRLAQVAYQGYLPAVGREPAPMRADYGALVAAGAVRVAVDEDEDGQGREGPVVGLLVVLPRADHLLLDNIAVEPGRQRRGVGTALLEYAEAEAARAGLPEIRLYTHETMTDNLAWYPRHGYQLTHRAEHDGYRRVHFAKRLKPAG
jgi:ribosomal protein S18 acetylase RimI-like enzyme